ncbi:MAG: amino acid ABC transporter permease [Chloroflexi bacterium]|nr:MAG: amino acid ABC transporter permease [Chloroflexota bacterium]
MTATHEPASIPLTLGGRRALSRLPWWALLLAAIGLLMVYMILSDQNYQETFRFLQVGVITTLRMTLIAFPIATVIGLFTGLARTSKNVFLFNLSTLYVETIRGIPLIVIILYIAFGIVPVTIEVMHALGEWGLSWADGTIIAGIFQWFASFSIRSISQELRAIIALAIGYGAFEAEVFRAGIESIGKGQMEAARSLGMNYMQAMRYIILPQAVRRVLPPLGNDFIALLKDSSLATVLAVPELTQLGRLRRASTFRYLETFNVVAFLYLAMTLLLSAGVRALERFLSYED